MQSILVIGGSGFVGKELIKNLQKRGHIVVSVSRKNSINIDGVINRFINLNSDLKETEESLIKLFNDFKFDAILVLSSILHSEKVLSFCPYLESVRFISLSTTSVLNKKASKIFVDKIIKSETFIIKKIKNFVIVRPNMIFGGKEDRNISKVFEYIKKRPIVFLPGLNGGLIQPIFYKDVAKLLLNLIFIEKFPSGNIYNVGGSEPITSRKFIKLISREIGKFVLIVPIPKTILLLFNKTFFIKKLIPISNEQIEKMTESRSMDNSDAKYDLSLVLTNYDEAIANLRLEDRKYY